jgi:hypothetical protein
VAEPVFELACGFDDVHSEATIARGGVGSQTRLLASLPAADLKFGSSARSTRLRDVPILLMTKSRRPVMDVTDAEMPHRVK